MEKIFLRLYRFFRHRKRALFLLVVLALAVGAFFVSRMGFNQEITRLFPEDKELHTINQVVKTHPALNRLVVTVHFADTTREAHPDSLVAYADSLVSHLRHSEDTTLWNSIRHRHDASLFLHIHEEICGNLPLFLTDQDYEAIAASLNKERLEDQLKSNYKTVISPMAMAAKKRVLRDPLGWANNVLERLKTFRLDDNFYLYNGHLLTKDHKNLLLFVIPADNNGVVENERLSNVLEEAVAYAGNSVSESVTATCYGSAVVEVANAGRIKKDVIITVSLAGIALFCFLFIYFRSLKTILLIFLPFVTGVGITFSLFYVFKSEVSLIALTIGSVLSGISIDYAIHFFAHGKRQHPFRVLRDVSGPVLTSCLTTAAAFLSLWVIRAEAFHDLALFAGISIILTAVISLVFLPHVLKKGKRLSPGNSFIDKLAAYPFHRKTYLLLTVLAVTIASAFFYADVGFEQDMQKNNYLTPALKAAEAHLTRIHSHTQKTVFVMPRGESFQEKLQVNEQVSATLGQLQESGVISNFTSPSSLLFSNSLQQERIIRWHRFWQQYDKDSLLQALITQGHEYHFNEGAFSSFREMLYRDYQPQEVQAFPAITGALLSEYLGDNQVLTVVKVPGENRQEVYEALGSYPALVFDKQYAIEKLVTVLAQDFNHLVLISLLVVFMMVFCYFQSFQVSLFTFLPMLIGWFWTLGIMGLLDIRFNVFNIIMSSFLFGLGIDYSIFISRGLLDAYNQGKNSITGYKSSVLISALTTLIGIGVLIFAQHPALRSIAVVSIVGMWCIVFVSFTLQPFLFDVFLLRNKKNGQPPYSMTDFFATALTAIFYLTFTIFIGLASLVVRVIPGKKTGFHKLMYAFARLMHIPFYGKREVDDRSGHDFSQPVILAANHQSIFDIPFALSLHPKIIVLVKEWVYRGIFYGRTVRALGYVPVEHIRQGDYTALKDKKEHSILVFPEGTRTYDGEIARFRSGLIHMQEALQLDVLPVLIHGSYHYMNRKDNLIKRYPIRMTLLPPLNLRDKQWGDTAREKSRNLRKYFREAYDTIRSEYEDVSFYRRSVLANYRYTGWKACREARKLVDDPGLELLLEQLPRRKSVLEIAAGRGVLSFFIASIKQPEKQVAVIPETSDRLFVKNRPLYRSSKIEVSSKLPSECFDVVVWHDLYTDFDAVFFRDNLQKYVSLMASEGAIIIYTKQLLPADERVEITTFLAQGDRNIYVITRKTA